MANSGKWLEAHYRRLRPYISPRYRRAFAQLTARGLSERHSGEPILCFDFQNPTIDAVGGRYYFSLVRDAIDAGYFPVFTARRATLSSFGTSRMKSILLKERLGVIPSLQALHEPYDLITDSQESADPNAKRMIKVDYTWRTAASPDEVEFPVFVHPQITTKVDLPYPYNVSEERPVRLFFGGNTEEGKYDKDVIRTLYGMLTRRDMLSVATRVCPDLYRPTHAETWLASDEKRSFVLCETQHCKIPPERWLDALAKADFFLACPGVGMPLCHNLIEALAAGTIPILQYADYLPHPLTHGVNCLTFQDPGSLRDTIARLLTMDAEEILSLRTNVRAYHDAHLAPGRFLRELFCGSHPHQTLLLNAYRTPR
ncbi:MAG: hypothetical protein QM627_06960 [Luteolibacter sp.]